MTSDPRLIPEEIRAALVETAMLFLGFRMDDWNFRVLFRSVISKEGGDGSQG
ncbi:hypothetical protein EKD04_021035 [Chloroflexales bacterium ZM16-3]|nr:hypothetical protein [Chloroflexales bacterium ZM16-3]